MSAPVRVSAIRRGHTHGSGALTAVGVRVQVKMSDYLGSPHFNAAALERSGSLPDASMAQVRQALTEYAVLPLGSAHVHERLEPHIKALLLYGHHDTGKKLLAHAVANTTGVPRPAATLVTADLVWCPVRCGSPPPRHPLLLMCSNRTHGWQAVRALPGGCEERGM